MFFIFGWGKQFSNTYPDIDTVYKYTIIYTTQQCCLRVACVLLVVVDIVGCCCLSVVISSNSAVNDNIPLIMIKANGPI